MSQDSSTQARRLAVTQAFNAFDDHFYRYFSRRTRDTHVAEDLCQDLWASVFLRFPIEKMSEIRLLQKRAGEILVDYARRKRTRSFVEFYDDVPDAPATAHHAPETEAEEMAEQARFWAEVPDVNLTAEQKTVFWMNKRLKYTIAEISEQLSIPVSTVHDWIKRAMEECKRSLSKDSL